MDNKLQVTLEQIASELSLEVRQGSAVIQLLDDDNTVPFITRYRKEQTGNLDEVQIREIERRIQFERQISEKAANILRLIDGQGKLTDSLREQIETATTLKRLDDLYLPFRPKRKSRAETARQKGLEPLAQLIRDGKGEALPATAVRFVDSEKDVPDAETALAGASDIIAEWISEDVTIRDLSRKLAWRTGKLSVSAAKANGEQKDEVAGEFQNYLGFEDQVWRIPPHRILALNRGEKGNALRVKFDWDRELARRSVSATYKLDSHPHQSTMVECVRDCVERLIHPSIEREVRRELTEQAERQAIDVFAKNLRSLLLQPPLRNENVLAIDPGFRTGCKLAALDEFGNCRHNDVIYVTGSAGKKEKTLEKLAGILKEHECSLIAIGNGTACRETEELVSELIGSSCPECRYVIVNEAGASVYSASSVAGEELPDYDATVRGTVSIGRRLQDPLSELVKIDPQHIGVGMYQHDMSARLLKESLDAVVESCVNFVGVNLNTASASLLKYASGLNQLIARRVVEWRETNGRFASRQQLMEVAGIGEATFTQAAGFLKITDGEEPLDATWIHPESYEVAGRLLDISGKSVAEILSPDRDDTRQWADQQVKPSLAERLEIGVQTLRDLVDALARPGRDPRGELSGPAFRQGILKLEDLSPGLKLQGTILNVVDFGAFVDVGLKDSGLVHVSQLVDRYISSPHDVVSVGDIVTVWVQSVDLERRRVSLTMISPAGKGKSSQDGKPRRKRRRKRGRGQKKTPETPPTGSNPATAEKPAAESPAAESPAAESPAAEKPAAESPASPADASTPDKVNVETQPST
ncbi:MAG: helix-hairpin-helix domain-containing protein [Planctomycetes bacterium]|nr:helix-hairpin-helix domain-containing protein [Planctomycetota bacterium]